MGSQTGNWFIFQLWSLVGASTFSIPQKLYLPFKGPKARIYRAIDKGMFFPFSFIDRVS